MDGKVVVRDEGNGATGGRIVRRVLSDQVEERLLERILAGEYPPGTRLIELRIAREFGTSQAPVREALRGLEALGVVEISAYRGARVRRPSPAEIIEGYAVRSQLESLAARLAVPNLHDEDLAALAAGIDEMVRAADAHDVHAVAAADAAFHGTIVRISGNATLERVWRTLEPLPRTLITLGLPGVDARRTVSMHRPILAALRAGGADAVEAAIGAHFEDARRMAERAWGEARTAGS